MSEIIPCRLCKKPIELVYNFGVHPIANSLLPMSQEVSCEGCYKEEKYWLGFYFCHDCQLGQLPNPVYKLFTQDYPYQSSINQPYVDQCEGFVLEAIKKYRLSENSKICEIACNDGYLLQHFSKRGFQNLYGIEPILSLAEICSKKTDADVYANFFDSKVAKEFPKMDLIIANNVLAHVPDVLDFIEGMKGMLAPEGIISIEVNDIKNLINELQFDNIYHEHLSYFSKQSLVKAFANEGLFYYGHDDIPSHGGSIRMYFSKDCRPYNPFYAESLSGFVLNFPTFIDRKIEHIQKTIQKINASKKSISVFGAAAKGISLLNYCGLTHEHIRHCFDDTPSKIGHYMPGSRIKIVSTDILPDLKPDVLWVLPWNYREHIMKKTEIIKTWGGEHLCF